MSENLYPNMEEICRLCLKENTGVVAIFPTQQQDSDSGCKNLSIPMRIMACVALEVQANDGLPKHICDDCRYQLEKTYLFRKQSQASDAKLKKHLRLLSLGKTSKVFRKDPNEDDDDDELEFQDSLDFIKQHDIKVEEERRAKLEALKQQLRAEHEQELQKQMASMKDVVRSELEKEVKDNVRKQLRPQIAEEVKERLLPKLREECLQEAKEIIREEIKEECRQLEMKNILNDMQSYLNEKQGKQTYEKITIRKMTQKIRPLNHHKEIGGEPKPKRGRKELKVVKVDQTATPNTRSSTKSSHLQEELKSNDRDTAEAEGNLTEEDEDSDNYYIYDLNDCDELKKKDGENSNADLEEYVTEQMRSFESSDESMDTQNNKESQKISTISYRLEDFENGEFTFLKKTNEAQNPQSSLADGKSNIEDISGANIMIITCPSEIVEEHLDMVDFSEDFNSKTVKPISVKQKKAKSSQNASTPSKPDESSSPGTTITLSDTPTEQKTAQTTSMSKMPRVTDTPKLFKCPDCPMAFSTRPSFERHSRTHRKVEETGIVYQCPECQVVLSCASALRRHRFVHFEKKPFECEECGKAFVQKEILNRHMIIHTGIRPHQCPDCDRAFAQRRNLQQHIQRYHMGEPVIQQHACHMCPKRFNHASGLSRHLASHSGVAFQCSECEKTFSDRSSIKRHIASKHGGSVKIKTEESTT